MLRTKEEKGTRIRVFHSRPLSVQRVTRHCQALHYSENIFVKCIAYTMTVRRDHSLVLFVVASLLPVVACRDMFEWYITTRRTNISHRVPYVNADLPTKSG
uniref:Uncharacterized protein n=1 Tax=Cacopsylla melanoneura TaxID=428564 RepID=A0A8D8Q6Y5_9HEMI